MVRSSSDEIRISQLTDPVGAQALPVDEAAVRLPVNDDNHRVACVVKLGELDEGVTLNVNRGHVA